MAWNEPGKGRQDNDRNNSDGPPDLDQVFKKLKARLFKGGGGGRNSNNDGGQGGGPSFNPGLLLWVVPIIAIIWLVTGFYVIQPGEKGVVLKFGAYEQTAQPGWHWYWPIPIGTVMHVDTQRVRSASMRNIVLTKDESLAETEISLQYRVSNAKDYLFSLNEPDHTVEQVLKSAVREVVGTSRLNQVIQEGIQPEELDDDALENVDLKESSDEEKENNTLASLDEKITKEVKEQKENYPSIKERSRALLPDNVKRIIQATLDSYNSGLHIIAVNVEYAQPPEQVQSAFEEAIRAREEKERKKNIARAYARKISSRVKGQVAEIEAKAKAYKAKKISKAEGESARFTRLLKQYQQAPEVTRRRLYLEAMEQVLGQAKVILSDQDSSGPVLYMPLPQQSDSDHKSMSKDGSDITDSDFLYLDQDDGKSQSSKQSTAHQSTHRSRERN